MSEPISLMPLLEQEYDIWCMKTSNPGGVTLDELRSAAFLMGDIHQNGTLTVSEDEAREKIRLMLEELNAKSEYAQKSSFLVQSTKGMSNGAKLVLVILLVILMAVLGLVGEHFTAKTMAEQGITEAASYSIA